MTGYPFPLVDPLDPGGPVVVQQATLGPRMRLRRATVRLKRRAQPRLAFVDSHFPWRISGFRYHEAEELLRALPDTMFFSLYRMAEPFPAPVYPLSEFPRLAPALGVTDVLITFLNFATGVLGIASNPRFPQVPGARNDISLAPTLERYGMRVHVTLYPGGGWLPDTPDALMAAVAAATDTVFASHPLIQRQIPSAVPTVVPVPSDFYPYHPRRLHDGPLRLVFVGDDRPRKGLAVLLDAWSEIRDRCTLEIVGPHERHAGRFGAGITTHGWLDPRDLRPVLDRADVIVSPSTTDRAEDGYGDTGLTDGFPTTAARIAMLSGCCLVASNPENDERLVRAGREYELIPERDPGALAGAILRLAADGRHRLRLAEAGAKRIREVADVRQVVREKLRAMHLS